MFLCEWHGFGGRRGGGGGGGGVTFKDVNCGGERDLLWYSAVGSNTDAFLGVGSSVDNEIMTTILVFLNRY